MDWKITADLSADIILSFIVMYTNQNMDLGSVGHDLTGSYLELQPRQSCLTSARGVTNTS